MSYYSTMQRHPCSLEEGGENTHTKIFLHRTTVKNDKKVSHINKNVSRKIFT